MTQMDWTRLLSSTRVPKPSKHASANRANAFRTPFEADCDRILFSPAFRRLAKKTQVHPFAENDHVHNRLTHSIEVASVGRGFGRRLEHFLVNKKGIKPELAVDVRPILQAACLAHDIGNPPFGHAGEFAIREWMKSNLHRIGTDAKRHLKNGTVCDLSRFEGNAQSFRLASRADNPKTGYMRLTYATLGAMVKYPWPSTDDRFETTRKHGVFSTENDLFTTVVDELGLRHKSGQVSRHPLSFLMEAADDICYRTLDLEDAVDLGVLAEDDITELFVSFLRARQKDASSSNLAVLRGSAIEALMEDCWAVFVREYDKIMTGTWTEELKSGVSEASRSFFETVKNHYDTIFATRSKVSNEIGSYELLGRILEHLGQAVGQLADNRKFGKLDFINNRRIELVWGREYAVKNESMDFDWWMHQVLDYVSGLTDVRAKCLSSTFSGH